MSANAMKQRGSPSQDYLLSCRDLHARVTELHYGRRQDLKKIEDTVAHIGEARQLTYDDIEKIRNSAVWDADVFGYWPPRAEIESVLNSTKWGFWNLRKREKTAVASLLKVFRQIEPVSVILRFIAPKHYGILSPPVEKVLGLGPFRRHAERYLAYLRSLRQLRNHRGFDTTADVDMALWVLQVGVLDGELLKRDLPSNEYRALQKGFRQDAKLREIRADNLTRQLFEDMSEKELAEALLKTNHMLAGQIAGIEFERSLRNLTQDAMSDDDLKSLIDDKLPRLLINRHLRKHECKEIVGKFHEARRVRNKAIHLNPEPTKEEVGRLIQIMKEVEGMEIARPQWSKDGNSGPFDGNFPNPTLYQEKFWQECTIDELAVEQGIKKPQQISEMIGAGSDFWEDERDFETFVKGFRERRIGKGQNSWECKR